MKAVKQFEICFDRENGYVVQKEVYMSLPLIEGIYDTEEEALVACSEANLMFSLTNEILAESYGMTYENAKIVALAYRRSMKQRGLRV